MSTEEKIQQLGQGFCWQDLLIGQRFKTFRRTVTEARPGGPHRRHRHG